MNEEILLNLTQIKWLLGISCIYLVLRDILKDSGKSFRNKS